MAFSWLDKNEYPFHSNYCKVNGYNLHYVDEGQGDTILFVHGTPSWSFDFRKIIKTLRNRYRCIAIDHIGFGLSDKPESYDYSTLNHSRTLEKFIRKQKLNDFTIVVHDFGGPVGLNVAMDMPEKIKCIIIMNSWLWSSSNDPDFIKLSRVLRSPFLPFLYLYLNFSPRFILPKSFGVHKLSKNILKQYTRPFLNKTERNGTLAFAHSLLNDQDWFEDLWTRKQSIQLKPTLLIWGMKDPVIKPHHLEKFASGFSNSIVKKLSSCGHFPQEEEPEQTSQFILEFLSDKVNQNADHP